MGMINLLLQGLVALGFRLLSRHISSDEDSSEVENAIIEAKTPDEIKAIVKKELIETIDREFMTDTEIPEEIVDGLANANSKEDVVDVLETNAGKKSLVDALGSFLGGIVNLVLGKK